MTYIWASKIGCALDCDLMTGLNVHSGGAATDDAPTINAAMAGATAANPITLIIDGGALISGLFLPAGGNWAIQGTGCSAGFFVKAGTNNDGIHNGGPNAANPSDPGPPAPARGSNVSLSNFLLNGNAGNGLTGDSTTGSPQGNSKADLFYCGINLMNLNNITLLNIVVVNPPSYHFRLSNVGNVVISGCITQGTGPNTDGIHFNGPANDISISNCSITAGDDGIALNCPEGYNGSISRVSVTNCTFNSWTMIRLYTLPKNTPSAPTSSLTVDTVTVTGCSGVFSVAAFLIGDNPGGPAYSVTGLVVSDCTLIAAAVLDISTDFGDLSFSNITLTPYLPFINAGFAFVRTSSYSQYVAYTGGTISIQNLVYKRAADYPVAAVLLQFGSAIGQIEFNGFAVQEPAGTSYAASPELLNIVAGSIGQVVIDGLTSAKITAPVSAGGFASIGAVSGAGVLATGWQFPDSVMTNGTPYLSANSGVASIKVAGVVQPYP